jgi:predicted small lipoprotein YifL
MKRLLILPALFLCALLVAACGQSGPLYLPGNPSTMSEPPPKPAEDASTESREDDAENEADTEDSATE